MECDFKKSFYNLEVIPMSWINHSRVLENVDINLTDLALLTGENSYFITTSASSKQRGLNEYIYRYGNPSYSDKNIDRSSSAGTVCLSVRNYNFGFKDKIDKIYEKGTNKKEYKDYIEFDYGEYPQMVVSRDMESFLENNYRCNNLRTTGKKYALNYEVNGDVKKNNVFIEYMYNNKKYIRYKVNIYNKQSVKLSNNASYKSGDYVWIEIKPVTWRMFEDNDNSWNIGGNKLLVTKYGLLSGVKYDVYNKKYNPEFLATSLKKYIDDYMLNDILGNEKICENDLTDSEKQLLEFESIILNVNWKNNTLFHHLEQLYSACYYDYNKNNYHLDSDFFEKNYGITLIKEKYNLSIASLIYIYINYNDLLKEYGCCIEVSKNIQLEKMLSKKSNNNIEKTKVNILNEECVRFIKKLFNENDLSIVDIINIDKLKICDLLEMKKRYKNVSFNVIKEAILKSNSKVESDIFLNYINNYDEDNQEKLLTLLTPIIDEFYKSIYSNKSVYIYDYLDIKNIDTKLKMDFSKINSATFKNVGTSMGRLIEISGKGINIQFIKQLDKIFSELIINSNIIINDCQIDKLNKIREYILENKINSVVFTEFEKVIEKKVIHYCDFDCDRDVSGEIEEPVFKPFKKICFSTDDVLKVKKLILILFDKIIKEENIDYKEIMALGIDSKYLLGLFDSINIDNYNKKVNNKCKTLKKDCF